MQRGRISVRIILLVLIKRLLPVGRWRRGAPWGIQRASPAAAFRGLDGWRWRHSPRRRRRGMGGSARLAGTSRGLKRMVVGNGTIVDAGLTAMRLEGILELGARRNVRVIVTIILSDFSFGFFSSLPGLRSCAGSAIRRGSTAGRPRRRWGRGPALDWHRRICRNRWRGATLSFLRRRGRSWGVIG